MQKFAIALGCFVALTGISQAKSSQERECAEAKMANAKALGEFIRYSDANLKAERKTEQDVARMMRQAWLDAQTAAKAWEQQACPTKK